MLLSCIMMSLSTSALTVSIQRGESISRNQCRRPGLLLMSELSRRELAKTVAYTAMAPLLVQAGGVPEGMKTSESYSNLQQIAPEITGTLGAGTMSSRSRPATGVVLLEEPVESGDKNAPTVSAELVLDGGVAATVAFQSEYPLIRGMFYDVEVRSKSGDGAFLQVAPLPEGKNLDDVNDSFLSKAVLSTEGRFGAYGAPTDIRILKSTQQNTGRQIELSFSALSPGQQEVPRKAILMATQPKGSTDALILVGGSTAGQFKKCEGQLRKMAASFRVERVRATSIKRKAKSDYRFEDQGGLNEKSSDSVNALI